MNKLIVFFVTILLCSDTVQAQLNNFQIWQADIRIKDGAVYFGQAQKIGNLKGYNNQPAFVNDSILLFSHADGASQSDIYQYRTKSRTFQNLTKSAMSEFSPKLLPNNDGFSVVAVEQDSTQRIWSYNLEGGNEKNIIPQFDSVGYYCWLGDTAIAAFVLTEPSTLQIYSIKNNQVRTLAHNIGRCLQVSSYNNLYFSFIDSYSTRWLCRIEHDGTITKLIEFLSGVEDFVVSNNNTIFCAQNGILFYTDLNFNQGWRMCANFESVGIKHISRLALNPSNKLIVFVNSED
ncbi:MAG: hypothetical protein IT238_02655 [Bacteroidia bacterium]|nr:hypothetical protein [Bacteroidia bacterium]